LVVIILRGAMDGLDLVQPYGDPAYAALRPRLAGGPSQKSLDLDGFYALHPAAASLMPLWDAGELAFAQAVSTPYRDKRSHFDGQDILEAGVNALGRGRRDGWLNRMLQHVAGVESETAYSIGLDRMYLMTGDAPVNDWSPDIQLKMSDQGQKLLNLVMHDDPLFQQATDEALEILANLDIPSDPVVQGMDMGGEMMTMAPAKTGSEARVTEFAASRLRGASRIAAFSLGGWDTHIRQDRNFPRSVSKLSDALLRLRLGLGSDWGKTTVIAMTEFGRTAFQNGSIGTDHGTGGLAILAGGALRGKRVYGDWPGLGQGELYQGRDLLPTRDVRAYPGWAMHMLFGLDKGVIENSIFPGLDMDRNPGFLT
ncbi:MAG: DUF1501 domain-containing protein, partial [Planktomarina sp.]